MFVKFFPVSRLRVGVYALTVLSVFTLSESAHARCSTRVADVLIKARYQGCNPKAMLSYLYSDLVTPFSFTCAKRLRETCHKENCADPKTTEEEQRCLSRYAEVLNSCPNEIEGAAKMARCKDTKVWAVNLPTKNPGTSALMIPATAPGNSTAPTTAGNTAVEATTPTTAAAVAPAPVTASVIAPAAVPAKVTAPVSVVAPATAPVTAAVPITPSVSNAPIITPATTGAVTGPAPILVAPGPVLAPLAPTVEVAAPVVVAPAAVTTTAPMASPSSAPTTVYRPIMTAPVAPTPAPNPEAHPQTQTQLIPIHRQGRIKITTPPRTLIYRASQSSTAQP